jgi:hypothetical protein
MTTMWSRHSRRIDPMSRSTWPFCHGERGAVGWSRIPHGLQSATDDCPVRPVAIPKQMARCLIPGECLGDLVRDPFGSRVRGDVGPHRASPVQPHDHDAIEKLKAYGRHDKQVDRADVRRMVTEESLPGLRPPSPLLAMYLATVDCAT